MKFFTNDICHICTEVHLEPIKGGVIKKINYVVLTQFSL